MACNTQDEGVDSSDDGFKEGAPGDVADSGDENDDNNCIEFAADGRIVVSKMACMANHMFANLSKLCTNSVKSVVEWCTNTGLHHDYLSKLEEF